MSDEIAFRTPPTPPPLRLPDLDGLTILVVDDNDDAVEILSTFLKVCGANVLMARSGMAAVGYVTSTPALDIVVTDIAMPGMDGVEFTRKVRSDASGRRLPVIALTGFYEHYASAKIFDAFLRKPVDLDHLAAVIKSPTGR